MKELKKNLAVIVISFSYYLFNSFFNRIPFNVIRVALARMYVKKIGKDCVMLMGVEIRSGKNIEIGNNVVINKKVLLDGRGGKLIIGDTVDIAQESMIWTLEHSVNDSNHAAVGADVEIKDHAWIGARSIILPGVTISRGAVVATGAVVTKNVEEKTIVGGVPAKKIGQRDNQLTYRLNFNPWFK